ncbi:MAG TPA: glycosyltransferase family 1 protein [bacterium]|nr:glycosyltransferase family 1 protein [bacterium]
MRVAYFTESLPPLTDGVARTYTRLAETLNQRKIDFRFFAPVRPGESDPWRQRTKRLPSVPFPLYDYYRVSIPYFQGLTEDLDLFKPEIIQVAAPTPAGFFAQDYAKRRGIPTVASYHTHFVDYFPYYGFKSAMAWGWNYMRWFYNRSLATYAPSPSTQRELNQRGFQNVRLWPRGINSQKFAPRFRSQSLRRRCKAGKGPLLLFVGRMVGEKDLEDLAQAAEGLRQKGHQFRLAFAGDGPLKEPLRKRLPQDYFTGFIQGKALAELYASADFFVFPSTTETFGNVVLEAFASGLPVVGANQGGSSDLVRHNENGFLARPKDAPDFARQMRKLLESPATLRRLRAGALKTAKAYDWDSINGRLIEDYGRFIQESRTLALAPAAHAKKGPSRLPQSA